MDQVTSAVTWLANWENRTRPNDNIWLTYSTNKEYIWVTEVPKELKTTVSQHVNDQFTAFTPGGRVGSGTSATADGLLFS